jgi:hypothetical protein
MVSGYRIGPISADYLHAFDTVKTQREATPVTRPIAVALPALAAGVLRPALASARGSAIPSRQSA